MIKYRANIIFNVMHFESSFKLFMSHKEIKFSLQSSYKSFDRWGGLTYFQEDKDLFKSLVQSNLESIVH